MSDKEISYKKAQMGNPVGFGKRPAVVVVDFQKRFTVESDAGDGGDMSKECKAARKLIDAARVKGLKIFYSTQGYRKDLVDLGVWGDKGHGLRTIYSGTWNTEIDENLEVREEDIVFEKHWPSVFFGSHLLQMLINLRVDTVILCGCTASGCLYASAVDACSYGFHTIVCEEASADRSEETRRIFLWNMNQKYADVMHLDDIIAYLASLPIHTL